MWSYKGSLKLRVTFGALISVTDVTTDVLIVFEYLQDKDSYWAAYFIMACISATMFFQCLVSYGQYHKCGKARVLREVRERESMKHTDDYINVY